METTNAASIEAAHLTRRYGSFNAVDDLTLIVQPGEFFGFLGPNGAGKSTTIRMLCGQLPPTSGTVRVGGFDVTETSLDAKRIIGVVPEETVLYEALSASEFLTFAGQMHGFSLSEARCRTDELLALTGLESARGRPIADYSMGMKKKTALAAALLHGPRVLFLDEPFNGVDPVSVRALCNVLQTAAQKHGVTVFFTSHVLETVERLCSRVAVLHQGKLAAIGTVPELRKQARRVSPSVPENASLEAVYLSLIGAQNELKSLSWYA